MGSRCCTVGIVSDVGSCRPLLGHGRGDGGRDFVNGADGPGNFCDGRNSGRRLILNLSNLLCDVLGGLGGLVRKILDLRGDDSEPFSCFARPSGLDGCVQRKQIGLGSDPGDQF